MPIGLSDNGRTSDFCSLTRVEHGSVRTTGRPSQDHPVVEGRLETPFILHNVVSDEHEMAVPIVVIDTYEQALYIDYHNRRAEYVEKFVDHIDWQEAERRYRATSV